MNPRLRAILIAIGLLTLVVVGIIVIPRGLSLYYQTQGGQHVDYVLRNTEGIEELVCEALPAGNEASRQEIEQGIADLQRATGIYGSNSHAYYQLGKAYCLIGQPEDAKENFSMYTQLRPDNPLGYIGLGFANERLGDQSAAREAWIAAGLKPGEFNSVGDEQFSAEDYESAIEWYQRALLIAPKSVVSLLNLGKVYEVLGDNESALDAYEKAWERDAERATLNYAKALISISEADVALDILEASLQNFPNSKVRLDWWKFLIENYVENKLIDNAEHVLNQAIQEFPDDPDLHINLGWVYYNQLDGFDLAYQEFEQAITLLDRGGRAHAALADLLRREGRFQEADIEYLNAIENAPNHRWYYLDRGDNARESGNLNTAIEIYLDAIERFPGFARAYYQLALAYHLNGDEEAAVDAISTSLDLLKNPVESYYLRAGEIFGSAGLEREAIEAYYQVLSLNPNNQSAKDGLDILTEN